MFRELWLVTVVFVLSSCAAFAPVGHTNCADLLKCEEKPEIVRPTLQSLLDLPKPNQKAVVSVYAFPDLTGQRKPSTKMALFSTAVTQGADSYVINALKYAANGEFFTVLDRGSSSLNNLSKERQIIKNQRVSVEGSGATKLPPLLFAGIIIEGGILSYESNLLSGGNGFRIKGFSPATNQWREDLVTVSMRVVLTQTGEVIMTKTVSKKILSASVSRDVWRFWEQGTELIELETGYTQTEATGYAIRSAIEKAVLELILEGTDKQFWDYDYEKLEEVE
jgi:curli production assembly/transport component CsgG